jgi:DNA helicase-2/ATP-dependent DNA helicase PcrA
MGPADPDARYVMVDEVQDYTEAQLMVLGKSFPRAHFLLLGDENQAIDEGTADFAALRRAFGRTHGEVAECHLGTSYRSTPAIARLFESLLAEDQRGEVTEVREDAEAPVVRACGEEEWLGALQAELAAMREHEGLVAVIAADRGRAKWLARQLDDVVLLDEGLPESGAVALSLDQAKGLEFDNVIVCDAQAGVYGDDLLSRRRLYTALSRATRHLTVLSQGPLTPLLTQ